MNVTLEQARALDALARTGTLQGAGRLLHKVHTAVLYGLNQLEAQTGLELLDRRGYRMRLTTAGEQVLGHCRRMLEAEAGLASACQELHSGWEPSLDLVFDVVFPPAPVLDVVRALKAEGAPTRVRVDVASLDEVERRFEASEADLMVAVLPSKLEGLRAVKLPRLKARLVAHRGHVLARSRKRLTRQQLAEHVMVTVRGSDPRLQLSTAQLDRQSTVQLPDFHAKKAAILRGLGFGWLPEWLIQEELRRKELVPLKTANTHAFEPRLYFREGRLGHAAARVVAALTPALRPGRGKVRTDRGGRGRKGRQR
jgi:DNA-binding transcriptional LysR family regulator